VKLQEQLAESRDKGKRKAHDLQGQMQEIIKKSSEDIDKIRQGYE
jgi:hypothetical protein